jgi:hypothetical protein
MRIRDTCLTILGQPQELERLQVVATNFGEAWTCENGLAESPPLRFVFWPALYGLVRTVLAVTQFLSQSNCANGCAVPMHHVAKPVI